LVLKNLAALLKIVQNSHVLFCGFVMRILTKLHSLTGTQLLAMLATPSKVPISLVSSALSNFDAVQ